MTTLRVTICFIVLLSQYSTVTAGHVTKNQGENLTIHCTTEKSDFGGVYLKARCPEIREVVFFSKGYTNPTYHFAYTGRIKNSKDSGKLTITISDLQKNDSGVYYCEYYFDFKVQERETVLLFVKEVEIAVTAEASTKETPAMPQVVVLVSTLTACTVLLLCMLVVGVWIIPKMKALCARQGGGEDDGSKAYSDVYEDMRAHRLQMKD
ncbi:uncharacterized protein [Salminus brasiliensis]|uniref:uncharacterized protein n=1 Tax=Salminus brasiliensis TaxID=930266 RepID=UPI003B838EE0